MNRLAAGLLIFLLGISFRVSGQARWAVEFNLGLPVNVPAPLTLSQNGKPDVKLTADWSAEPYSRPYNWMWRIGRWNQGKCWAFETIHHKMVLQNRPDNVQWLGITHGYNTVTINRGWEIKKMIVQAGGGGVLAHPESTIDSLVFNQYGGLFKSGYYLRGPVLMTSLARPLRISKWFMVNLEGTFTIGYTKVPIINGTAQLLHMAFHLNAGLGFSMKGRSGKPK